jgi:probable rRNA maturation factor
MELLRNAAKEALAEKDLKAEKVEVSILLIDDAEMARLNKQYRDKEGPTDVLSFAQNDGMAMPGTSKMLGDVVVSIDTAERQAIAAGRTIEDETAQLVIHGVLHLLGYDDVDEKGFMEMVEVGQRVWKRISIQ